MNRILVCLSAMLLISLSFVASAGAAVFERDWKTPGDGLLTFDDVNLREWLDVSESLLIQFPGTTLEDRYQSALAELAPNGRFEGFTVARSGDVIALAESAGIDTTSLDFNINQAPTSQLIDVLSPTFTSDDLSFVVAVGFLDELVSSPPFPTHFRDYRFAAEFVVATRQPPFAGNAGLNVTFGSDSISRTTTGVMLYRVVPEPVALALAIVCTMHLLLILGRERL